MLHVGFGNFVWLSHGEIEDALRAKSTLFLDYLPENSSLEEVFDGALTGALAAKGIAARVTHETAEPTMLRPERSIEFRIITPVIRVANVKLGGVSTELVPLIQKSVNAAARFPYNEGLAGQTTEDRILAPLLDAGYIQASLSGVTLAPTSLAMARRLYSPQRSPPAMSTASPALRLRVLRCSLPSRSRQRRSCTQETLPRAHCCLKHWPRSTPPIADRAIWT